MVDQSDVDKLTRALQKEREEHKATREKLSKAHTRVVERAVEAILRRALYDLRALT